MSAQQYGWLAYTQLLDSALPIGAFAHSFGLETMVQQGKVQTVTDLNSYIQAMMAHSWASADALGVKAVYVCAPTQSWERLWEIDRMLHTSRAAAETRDGMHKMGKRLLLLAKSMYPELGWHRLEQAMKEERCIGTHPVVHGWAAHQLGVELRHAVEGYLYSCLSTVINSALRLMPIGQTQGQKLLAELLPLAAEGWKQAEQLEPEQLHAEALAADIYMMRHETLYSRLFMS